MASCQSQKKKKKKKEMTVGCCQAFDENYNPITEKSGKN